MKLIAPPHTPFHDDYSLNLDMVEAQAEHFVNSGVQGVFVAGSTGEGASLSVAERMQLAERWVDVSHDLGLAVIIQVGHNCHEDACYLARHAASVGATAVSSMAPSYFKPQSVSDLVDICKEIADAATPLPFYYYDIPVFTDVRLPMVEFLERAQEAIPTFAGLKYTNPDLVQLQEVLQSAGSELEVLFGCDEILLSGVLYGCRGAVGSTYNLMANENRRMVEELLAGQLAAAARSQLRFVELIRIMQKYGFTAACKAAMKLHGIDCGPVRRPLRRLSIEVERTFLSEVQNSNAWTELQSLTE